MTLLIKETEQKLIEKQDDFIHNHLSKDEHDEYYLLLLEYTKSILKNILHQSKHYLPPEELQDKTIDITLVMIDYLQKKAITTSFGGMIRHKCFQVLYSQKQRRIDAEECFTDLLPTRQEANNDEETYVNKKLYKAKNAVQQIQVTDTCLEETYAHNIVKVPSTVIHNLFDGEVQLPFWDKIKIAGGICRAIHQKSIFVEYALIFLQDPMLHEIYDTTLMEIHERLRMETQN
jgi:hypothetical protein